MPQLNIGLIGAAGMPAAVTQNYTTFSDADLQKILTWVKMSKAGLIQQMFNTTTPTNPQLFQAWVQDWINNSIRAQQITTLPAPVVPPPVVIGA